MAAFNLTGQGMQRNAEVGLFTKPSLLVFSKIITIYFVNAAQTFFVCERSGIITCRYPTYPNSSLKT
jgi:hypothetical protein